MLFYLFGAVAIVASLLVIAQKNPIYSVLLLIASFGALSGLGLIMQDIGDDKHALDAYRKAVDVYPRLKGMDEKIKTLKEKVEGRDL